jgi:hypothetical protein
VTRQPGLQPSVVLVVRVFPSGTPGAVLIDTEQQGPVFLTEQEIGRTLRSAARRFDDDDPPGQPPAPPHGYMPGSVEWCLRIVGGRVCGRPWDDAVHGLQGWGLEQQG